MSGEISFIHAADLHLDSPFKGLANVPGSIFKEICESTFVALDRLVSVAIDKKVDFVLMVGDLFDNERQSVKAQIRLRKAFEELKKHHINVYMSYGNHDHINGNIHPVTYPDNVFIFPSEKVSSFIYKRNRQPIAQIYGFSYENRAVLTKKALEYKIADKSIPFHIAMLHGSVQKNTVHDVYAPFQKSDLFQEDFDYWALGHIHQREIVEENPPVVYPGNTQGRHRKETGEKGCYHVVLSKTNTEMSFVPLQALQFTSLHLDVSTCDEVHQIEMKIQHALKRQQHVLTPQLIDLTLSSNHANLIRWKNDKHLEDIVDLINQGSIQQQHWHYIFRISARLERNQWMERLDKGDHFIAELSRQMEGVAIQPQLTDLFNHPQGRKYLEMISEEDEWTIKSEARQLLMNELLKNEGE